MTTVNISAKKVLTGMMAMTMVFLFNACAKKTTAVAKTETTTVTEAPVTTATSENVGQVQIKRDVNSNYVIQINVHDLKEISSLDPNSKNAYIVWMDADNQATKSLGQINNNTGWLTDKTKATFEAVSAVKPSRIMITSEDNAAVKTPGKMVIWTTSRF